MEFIFEGLKVIFFWINGYVFFIVNDFFYNVINLVIGEVICCVLLCGVDEVV